MKTQRALELSREQVLSYRRLVGGLNERLPLNQESLRRAAWAGLQDSMPRAALLSIHARVEGAGPSTWEDPSLVQLWGPRFSAYVVAAADRAVFTLGRWPEVEKNRQRAERTAARLDAHLAGRVMTYGEAGRGLGVQPNSLRYAAPTGTVLIRWEGARQPTIWTVPPPEMDPTEARLELARRHLHVFGPTTATAFAQWAGIRTPLGHASHEALAGSLMSVRTPIGGAWILASDEATLRARHEPVAGARLLPSGDSYFLLQGADRELLVPEPDRRGALWTSRVWPGAVLLNGELVGTWRRANTDVTVQPWRRLSEPERAAIRSEAESLPLPAALKAVRVNWAD